MAVDTITNAKAPQQGVPMLLSEVCLLSGVLPFTKNPKRTPIRDILSFLQDKL